MSAARVVVKVQRRRGKRWTSTAAFKTLREAQAYGAELAGKGAAVRLVSAVKGGSR